MNQNVEEESNESRRESVERIYRKRKKVE